MGRLIEVRYDGGLYLPELDLWLDPPGAKPRAFVSHAHGDHFARHAALLCSSVTSTLIQRRFKLPAERIEAVDLHQPVARDGFRLRLLPAGHIAGSAMLHVTRLTDGATLLYTGDFKIRRSRTAEPIGLLAADTLIMETTFGLPEFVFPGPLEVEAALLGFVHDTLADGDTPVLCGYSLGKAQELVALLVEHGLPTLQHPTVAEMTRACREAGVDLPEPVECIGSALPGQVVVAPPSVLGSAWLRGLRQPRTALATGWALQRSARYRHRAHDLIPFSDHADHPGLLECIQRVRPSRVLTVHGFAREFAAELRGRGLDAWCAMGNDQLELSLASPSTRRSSGGLRHVRAICPFADFSDVCRLMGETSSRVAKIKFLAGYLRGLGSDHDLGLAVRWLSSGIEPSHSAERPLRVTAATLRRALDAVPGVRVERCHECFKNSPDPARAARVVLQEIQLRPEPVDLPAVEGFLLALSQSPAPLERITRLSARLATLHPVEAETLIKLLLGQPSPDLLPDTLEAAVVAAFSADPALVRRALQLTGDWPKIIVLARHGRLSEVALTPLVAVRPMCATTLPHVDDGIATALPFALPLWLEPACPGLRAQIHKSGQQVAIFAADCQPLTAQFPALVFAASRLTDDFILDGVIVGAPEAADAAAHDLFARMQPLPPPTGLCFIAFDLLWQGGEDLTALPLRERRERLASLALPPPIEQVVVISVAAASELATALDAARNQGHPGLIAKDPDSPYDPATQTTAWLRISVHP